MYELRLGQPFQHNSMPEMRATFANAGELCQQSGHFYGSSGIWSDEYMKLTINRVYSPSTSLSTNNQ